jgi:peptide/nickel transport system substrate-binding protein
VSFYYNGRGALVDPRRLDTYCITGVSPRIGYSNPQVDALFEKERAEFDPLKRNQVLTDLISLPTDEAPAHSLWRHKLLIGMARNIEHQPRPDDRVFARDIRVP